MRITGYKREDFDEIMKINDLCYSGIYRAPRDTVRDMVNVSDVYVARRDECDPETVIGFAIVQNIFQPYLWNIAVHPFFQGRGIAGNLLREMIKTYTLFKQKEITLHVNADNPAQKLYFDYGFRVTAFAAKYFDPQDGLLMRRVLP